MPSATTIASENDPFSRGARAEPESIVLVIAWSAHEPQRIGEHAVVPGSGAELVLGRGESEDGSPRVRFFRSRPGKAVATAPLGSPGLSREQLRIRSRGDELDVERVGRCDVRVNGADIERAPLRAGDTVYIRGELLLYCTKRAFRIPGLRYFPEDRVRAFGEPDAIGILGESVHTWRLREEIAFTATSGTHALVLGESGTGKELTARAIHALSSRANGPFVARSAATLPEGLVDAELFGNARNYPNPGTAERGGLIGEANGGSFFLDELGEMDSARQAHLLRVLDADGEYQRLGETSTRRSSFRLIAATNRDPESLKHDLLARLGAPIHVPSLGDRREDIPLLIRHLVLRAASSSPAVASRFVQRDADGATSIRIQPALVDRLLRRAYTVHTRELDTILRRSMAESPDDVLVVPRDMADEAEAAPAPAPHDEPTRDPTLEEIRAALACADNSVARAARALGLRSRYALYRLMKKHGIAADAGDAD